MNNRAKQILISNYPGRNMDLLMVDLSNRMDGREMFDEYGDFTPEGLSEILKGELSEERGRYLMIQDRVMEVAEKRVEKLMPGDAAVFDQMLYQLSEPTISVLLATGSAVSKQRIEALIEMTWEAIFEGK